MQRLIVKRGMIGGFRYGMKISGYILRDSNKLLMLNMLSEDKGKRFFSYYLSGGEVPQSVC